MDTQSGSTARRYVVPAIQDALVVVASLLVAWSGRSITASLSIRPLLTFGLLAAAVYCSANYLAGLYNRIWRYASAGEILPIAASTTAGTALLMLADLCLFHTWARLVPLSVVLFTGLFALFGFTAVRYQRRVWTASPWRWWLLRQQPDTAHTRVLIVGAGDAGQLLAWRFLNQRQGDAYHVVGFVDDDRSKLGMRVHGFPVLGDRNAIPTLVTCHRVDLVILAIYNLTQRDLHGILQICEGTLARVKVLPDVFEFIERSQGLPALRDITMEDLVGRQSLAIDQDSCRHLLSGKTVLITGAAGSIGSELCRQVARFAPELLLLLDNNESGLYDLGLELGPAPGASTILPVVADVTNEAKIQSLFAHYRPQIVFHAAAYKHVPLMEEYPDEAVRVNILGTRSVIDAACQCGADRFVFISTDKAVSPTSIMGATKRVGELLVASRGAGSATLCTAVRFGNVLGSRGSVVPTFEKQIEMGGPITITHPEMTRFFMSIPEAVSLVIQAATLTEGGDSFVLDMGEQVKIEELAERLIRLRGLRPGVDVSIKYTGIRPGEKLHEELTGDGDEKQTTSHPSIFRVNGTRPVERNALDSRIEELARMAQENAKERIPDELWRIVAEAR